MLWAHYQFIRAQFLNLSAFNIQGFNIGKRTDLAEIKLNLFLCRWHSVIEFSIFVWVDLWSHLLEQNWLRGRFDVFYHALYVNFVNQ